VIEGACRHLIADRLSITDAGWGPAGAEAVLKLRAVQANGDLDVYFRFHLAREHERVHHTRYQDRYRLIAWLPGSLRKSRTHPGLAQAAARRGYPPLCP
jgi:hypothetical protein